MGIRESRKKFILKGLFIFSPSYQIRVTHLFLEVVDKHIPIKQHRVKHKNQPQWLTPEIIDSIKTRDRFKAFGNDEQFKTK